MSQALTEQSFCPGTPSEPQFALSFREPLLWVRCKGQQTELQQAGRPVAASAWAKSGMLVSSSANSDATVKSLFAICRKLISLVY